MKRSIALTLLYRIIGISLLAHPTATAKIPQQDIFDRTVEILGERLVDEDLRQNLLPGLAERYRPLAEAAETVQEVRAITFELLSHVPVSHLTLLSGSSYRHLMEELWGRPSPTLGFELLELDGGYFVSDVVDGGPAAEAGLRTGDQVLAVDGVTTGRSARLDWRTDDAYLDDPPEHGLMVEEGETVTLRIARRPGEELTVQVIARPYSLLEGTRASARTIESGGVRIGYVHIWLVQIRGAPEALKEILTGPLAGDDVLVLDLRGRGGSGTAIPRILGLFDGPEAVWTRPIISLVDHRSRSAKDVLAYEFRKSSRAILVGERTAGAALPAVFEEVGHDTVLMFPVFEMPGYTDLLERKPVEPHVHVTAAGPFSAGHDPILERGLHEAVAAAAAYRDRDQDRGLEQVRNRDRAQGHVQDPSLDLDTVLARMVEALGGEDLIRRRTTITQTGTFEIEGTGITGDLVSRAEAPNKLRVILDLQGIGRIDQGYDGEIGWDENPATGKKVLEGRDLLQRRNQADYLGPLSFREHYDEVRLTGLEEFAGTPCYVIRLSYGGTHATTVFVNTESFLIRGTRDTVQVLGNDVQSTSTFKEYRDFDGLRFATVIETDVGGFQKSRTVITGVSFEPHPPDTFTRPAWIEKTSEGGAPPPRPGRESRLATPNRG